jgi:AcrR family transcriptional regulator
MRSLASEARAAREALVLDAAAVEFNRAGVAGANLAAIAAQVGISRAGIYTYCADREDLALKTYLRACALTARDLERAQYGPADGAGRLQAFLRLTLALDHPPIAVLADLNALSAERQAAVRAARADNMAALGAILQTGMADGSLRTCNPELACQTIWGVLSWAPMARAWTGETDESFAIRMAAAIPDLLMNGIAARPQPASRPPIRLFDEAPAYRALAGEADSLLARGSLRFNQRGVDGVSLEDLSAELGATKGLVYHRFRNKPAFVAACYERAFALYDAIMTIADAAPTAAEGTRLGLELNIQAQLSDVPPMSLSAGFEQLSKADRARFIAQTRALRARSTERGHRGVRDGSLRAFDAEPVTLLSAGIYSYLAKWPPQAALDPSDISREVADTFLFGLRGRGG